MSKAEELIEQYLEGSSDRDKVVKTLEKMAKKYKVGKIEDKGDNILYYFNNDSDATKFKLDVHKAELAVVRNTANVAGKTIVVLQY